MRDVERGRHDVLDRRAGGDRRGDHGGEDARGLATVARLVGAREVDRLGVRAARVTRVGQPTGATYMAAPQLTMLPTPASRGSTCP